MKIRPAMKNGIPNTMNISMKFKKPVSGSMYNSLINGILFIIGIIASANTPNNSDRIEIRKATLFSAFMGRRDEYTPDRPKQNMASVITI